MKLLLAIETSCDDTSISVIQDGHIILSNIISSQGDVHTNYGGIVPEVASRLHTETIHLILNQALSEAKIGFTDLSAIAVTMGPGLEGSLLVGIIVAKTLAQSLDIPLIPVNHLLGHVFSYKSVQSTLTYPCISLIVSGGHTQLILMKNLSTFEIIGTTRDDAAGEAFDKIARYLGLDYPGGPIIEQTAISGNPLAFSFPIALKHDPLNFSFSGLKTAVIDTIDSLDNPQAVLADLCASFQYTVIQTLLLKSLAACREYSVSTLLLSGGVTANQLLQQSFHHMGQQHDITVIGVDSSLCTDNAAMIGFAGFHLPNYYSNNLCDISPIPSLSL